MIKLFYLMCAKKSINENMEKLTPNPIYECNHIYTISVIEFNNDTHTTSKSKST